MRVNIFTIGVMAQDRALLHEVGVHNVRTSHRKEPGTLAMFVAERVDAPGSFIVFEVYEGEAAYATHRASEQYQNYVSKAGSKLVERTAYEVRPIFLAEKLDSDTWLGPDHYYLKFARVETSPEGQPVFAESVLKNMKTSLKEEDGVLAMYAVQDQVKAQVWYFFEVYASQAAYQAHRETSHFQKYLAETKDLVLDKQLLDLVNDASMSQGKLRPEIN